MNFSSWRGAVLWPHLGKISLLGSCRIELPLFNMLSQGKCMLELRCFCVTNTIQPNIIHSFVNISPECLKKLFKNSRSWKKNVYLKHNGCVEKKIKSSVDDRFFFYSYGMNNVLILCTGEQVREQNKSLKGHRWCFVFIIKKVELHSL